MIRTHPKDTQLYIGAMSGTSADSIDAVLVDFSSTNPDIIAQYEAPLDADLQQQIIALSAEQHDSLHDALVLDRQLGIAFAEAINALIEKSEVEKAAIRAIGSHGQTLRHQTYAAGSSDERFSLQIGDPNTIAELCGIDVVADFRRRDIAAGGEAAPLAPGFHHHFFTHAKVVRAVVNVGGFCNVSLLAPNELPLGFDTGPGNCLLDGWIHRHLGLAFDQEGRWAAEGQTDTDLLIRLKGHEYFHRSIPKSTGRELFNMAWINQLLADTQLDPADVQSTLLQLTVETLLDGLAAAAKPVEEIYICGGGAQNTELMSRLEKTSGLKVETTAALGVDPKLIEGCAFAWMAKRTLDGEPANLPSVTGASGPRILGGIYRA